MILSKAKKFIFIKTRKTGGTSLEIALSKFCGVDDIITPISKIDEVTRAKLGHCTRRNYRKSFKECNFKEVVYWLLKGIKPKKFYNHMSAKEIKRHIDPKTWEDYYKFTIERNPWDKTVSRFFWKYQDLNRNEFKPMFKKFIMSGKFKEGSDYEKYTINDKICLDDYIKYSNLESELKELSYKLDLDENIYELMKSIRAKGSHRPKSLSLGELYDRENIKVVEKAFEKEIELFDFKYDDAKYLMSS